MSGTIQYNTLFINSIVLRNRALAIILTDSQRYTWHTTVIMTAAQNAGLWWELIDSINYYAWTEQWRWHGQSCSALELSSWAALSIFVLSLRHSAQFSMNMASLFRTQMERSFVWRPWVYPAARRGADLRSWPFPQAVPVTWDDGWNLRPTMAHGDTDRGPGDKQRGSSVSGRKEMTNFTMEYCCKSSFKCGWMGWSLHMAFWLAMDTELETMGLWRKKKSWHGRAV